MLFMGETKAILKVVCIHLYNISCVIGYLWIDHCILFKTVCIELQKTVEVFQKLKCVGVDLYLHFTFKREHLKSLQNMTDQLSVFTESSFVNFAPTYFTYLML